VGPSGGRRHERLHGGKLLGKRLAALDGGAQRNGEEREAPDTVGSGRCGDFLLGAFRGLLQRCDATAERFDVLVVRRLRGRQRRIFLRGLECSVGAGLCLTRGGTRRVGTLRQLRQSTRRRFERGDSIA
jgi:hypothetical protein